MQTGSHSDYNALQTSVSQTNSRIGLSYQASYTFSKSIDDTSAVLGGLPANAGLFCKLCRRILCALKTTKAPPPST